MTGIMVIGGMGLDPFGSITLTAAFNKQYLVLILCAYIHTYTVCITVRRKHLVSMLSIGSFYNHSEMLHLQVKHKFKGSKFKMFHWLNTISTLEYVHVQHVS